MKTHQREKAGTILFEAKGYFLRIDFFSSKLREIMDEINKLNV